MKSCAYITIITLSLLIMLAAGCFSSKAPYDGGTPPPPNPSESSVFPHAAGWAEPAGHGKFVVSNGTGLCASTCHGPQLEGGSGRACNTCHTIYPHQPADIWPGITGHGKYVHDKGDTKECSTSCHGTDFGGGFDPNGKKACSKCHASYPVNHSDSTWETKTHGTFVVNNSGGSKECSTMCHRPNAPDELRAKACSDCHPSYPELHDSAWGEGSHADYIASLGGIASSDCTICHGADLNGGISKVECRPCHEGGLYPHTENWALGTGHGASAKVDLTKCSSCHGTVDSADCKSCHHDNSTSWATGAHAAPAGSNPTNCKTCHGTDLKGGVAGKSCFDCHDSGNIYPHPDGWENQFVHGVNYIGNHANCQSACHGKDLKGGLSGVNCTSCHTTYPHTDGWNNTHGASVLKRRISAPPPNDEFNLTAFSGSGVSSCSSCHGPAYSHRRWEYPPNHITEMPLNDLYYVAQSNVARCYKCHFAYPHEDGKITPNGTTLPWLSVHKKSISAPWGSVSNDEAKVKESCATGSGCHAKADRKGPRGSSLNPPLGSSYCISYCHK